jgi:hypothetical protein
MASSNETRKRSTSQFVGAAVRDPYAQFVFGMAPHPALLGRQSAPPEPVASKPAKPKGVFGPALQTATAGTLFAESLVHRMTSTAQGVAQISIGHAQRTVGVLGAFYYGRKAQQEGGVSNYLKTVGYGAFAVHGTARMFFPQASFTPFSGATAALAKGVASGPFSFPGFAADFAANVVELGHSFHHPRGELQQVVSAMSHQVKTRQLMRTQRFGAAVLAADAAYDFFQAYQKARKR